VRFCEGRPERKEPERPPLTGDVQALARLFSQPQGLPHGISWAPPRAERRKRRQERLHRRQWHFRRQAATRRLERFGLDVAGAPEEVANARRLLRNARKQERQGAR
jgi:hypothetical protein